MSCASVDLFVFILIGTETELFLGEEGQRERERILSRLHAQRGAPPRAGSHDPEIMT